MASRIALQRVPMGLAAIVLGALAAAPEDVDAGAELGGQVDVAHRLADGRAPHAAVVGRERAVLEGRVAEQVGRRHRHDQAGARRGPRGSAATMRSRSAAGASHGTRSSSCRLTPYAPSSARRSTISTGSRGARVGTPNGSRPGLPTVHRPKVKRCSGRGRRSSSDMRSSRGLDIGTCVEQTSLRPVAGSRRGRHARARRRRRLVDAGHQGARRGARVGRRRGVRPRAASRRR